MRQVAAPREGATSMREPLSYSLDPRRTALILAAATNKPKLVRWLLSKDLLKVSAPIDRHVRDDAGLTALDHARAQGHATIVRMLEK